MKGKIEINLGTNEDWEFKFIDEKIGIKEVNFIFGKNGTGKSTLCEILENQLASEYDLRVFQGFESVLTSDGKLNSIILGEKNKEINDKINIIDKDIESLTEKKELVEQKLMSLEYKDEYEELGISRSKFLKDIEEINNEIKKKGKVIDNLYTQSAKNIKDRKDLNFGSRQYNATNFKNDINSCEKIDINEENKLLDIVRDDDKEKIERINIEEIKFKEINDFVLEILNTEIKEQKMVSGIKTNPESKNFAKKGLEIHKENDICSFCGNIVTSERIEILNSYFDVKDVKNLQNKIIKAVDRLKKIMDEIKNVQRLNQLDFYKIYSQSVASLNDEIEIYKLKAENFIEKMINSLVEKQKDLFNIKELEKVDKPDDIKILKEKINQLINENNNMTKDITEKKKDAFEKLKLHYVAVELEQNFIFEKKKEIEQLETDKNNKNKILLDKISELKGTENDEDTIKYYEYKIDEKKSEKNNLFNQTESTEKFVGIINNVLNNQHIYNLKLDIIENNNIEHYVIRDEKGIRNINQISTGEKNIIAFLYFIAKLDELSGEFNKTKVIVFDDPMTSNDDTLQYLMLETLNNLMNQNKNDYFVIMTHNMHFYLNAKYSFSVAKDGYKKNNFYHFIKSDKGTVVEKIENKADDFKTSYDYMWKELNFLYECNKPKLMLNPIRVICETYTKFNNISLNEFYEKNESSRKLFHVNSHAIDDYSSEQSVENRDEIYRIMKKLFEDNNALAHFERHWHISLDYKP